ncbi:MAG: YddF family protein [Armatimonadetes bacterium]|nr:YddF family protein [Armatimonadota bacterium]MDW8122707.1 hypothetical protein [Armatimonadota bacterium]
MGKVQAVLNALVPPQWRPAVLVIEDATVRDVKAALEEGAVSFIGHPATAALLGVDVNRGEFLPGADDVALVVRLKRRAGTVGDVQVTLDDLEVLKVTYRKNGTQGQD